MDMGLEGVNRIHLAQDRDLWWTVVNMVTKDGEFLDQLSNCQLFKKACAVWSEFVYLFASLIVKAIIFFQNLGLFQFKKSF
jgi:hypothetical protein